MFVVVKCAPALLAKRSRPPDLFIISHPFLAPKCEIVAFIVFEPDAKTHGVLSYRGMRL